jgi:hypothetical protein
MSIFAVLEVHVSKTMLLSVPMRLVESDERRGRPLFGFYARYWVGERLLHVRFRLL